MAKKRRVTKKTQEKRGTNWLLIGGIIVIGVIVVFGLLYLAVRQPTSAQNSQSLAEFCQENSTNCITMGSDSAPITLVEVSDFGCPHCRAFHQEKASTIKDNYVDQGQVKWVFLPYALRAETVPAANAAMCSAEYDKYFEFSSALFNQDAELALTRDGFLQAANEVGIPTESFTTCLEENRYGNVISANQQAARSARVTGTPTFFVNDQIVRGNVPLEEFENIFNRITNS